jgi:hypothetical protein
MRKVRKCSICAACGVLEQTTRFAARVATKRVDVCLEMAIEANLSVFSFYDGFYASVFCACAWPFYGVCVFFHKA